MNRTTQPLSEKQAPVKVARPLPPPNPLTRQAHRRDVARQITLPLVLGIVAVLALAGLAVWAGFGAQAQVTLWSQIATVWVIIPVLLFGLITMVVVAAIAAGVTVLIRKLPPYAHLVQDFFGKIAVQVHRLSDRAVEPVIRAHAARARLGTLRRKR